jgi:wyosine [tRNA(Phe)-imidazoG37] synthetase (radical SAM superfamily)
MEVAFGPVPSRRLGRSLGINNVPNKICTYNCVYCQLGNTVTLETKRRRFYDPAEIVEGVQTKINAMQSDNIDYVTFVPDGEPTLDINLGVEISKISNFGVKTAIITNSSLIHEQGVQEELEMFDLVSLKVDAVTEGIWNKVNRPSKGLEMTRIKEGMKSFSKRYRGKLITETMLVGNVDYGEELEKIASFLAIINPEESYISIPIRPTPEKWATPADPEIINHAYQLFSKVVRRVELLTTSEGEGFFSTGDFEKDLLGITSVHPIRDDTMLTFLKKYGKDAQILRKFIDEKKLISVYYNGHYFYLRRFKERETLL